MKKILKSYFKSFYKNWFSTMFIVIFLIALSTAIIGILTTPIQIYSKLNQANSRTIKYDNQVSLANNNRVQYSGDLIMKYMFENTEENPFDKTVLGILKYNNNITKPANELKQSELQKIETAWNSAWSAYRSSALNSITFDISKFSDAKTLVKDEFAGFEDVNAFRNYLISQHIYKSLLEARYEYNNFVTENGSVSLEDSVSILIGAIYRVVIFFQINKIVISLNNLNAIQLNEILNSIDWNNISYEKISDFIAILIKGNVISWNPTSKVYLLSYTFLNDSSSEILASNLYQHDDRIFTLFNLIGSLDREYEMVASTSFSISAPSNLLGSQQTFDLKADQNYILSKEAQKNESDISNIIFDNNVQKNSKHTSSWNAASENVEVIVSSAYAKANNLSLGAPITLPSSTSIFSGIYNEIVKALNLPVSLNTTFEGFFSKDATAKIVGIGQTFEDYTPGPSYSQYNQETKDYAVLYANSNYINQYKNYEWKYKTSSETTSTTTFKIKNINSSASITPSDLVIKDGEKEIVVFNNTSSILKSWADSPIDDTSTNLQIRIIIFIILSVVILFLAFIFINFNIKKEINDTRKQLGIFKSSGYFTNELSWIFALKTFVIFFISISIGFFLSMPFQQFAARGFENTLTLYYAPIYFSVAMFFGIVFGIPLLFLIIGFLLTLKDLNEHPLSLINNAKRKPSKVKDNFLVKFAIKKNIFFTWRLRRAFIKNSKGKFIVIQTLFAFSSLSYILIFGAQTVSAKIINQSFSLYKDSVNHSYTWNRIYDQLNIQDDETKYDWNNKELEPISLNYVDYSNYRNVNDYLNVNNQSNLYRYKFSALMQMTNNYYSELDSKSKVEFMLPKEEMIYTLVNSFGTNVKKNEDVVSTPSFLKTIFNYNLNSGNLIDAANDIKSNGKTDRKLIISDIENPDDAITLMNITPSQMSNFFFNDIAELFSIKMFQITALYNQITQIIKINDNDTPFVDLNSFMTQIASQDERTFDYDSFLNATSTSQLIQEYDPSSPIYWTSNTSNPMFTKLNEVIIDKNGYTDQQIISLIYASKMQGLSSALSTGLFMSDLTNNSVTDKIINVNQLFYDKSEEVLLQNMSFRMGEKAEATDLSAYLLSNQTAKYGDFREVLNFDGVTNDQMDNFLNPKTNEIAAIIPYYLYMNNNLNVGDVFTIHSKTLTPIDIPVKVVGVNSSETIKLSDDSIMLNKEQFEEKYYSDNLRQTKIFTSLFSKKDMLESDISLANIVNAFSNTVNKDNNLSLTSDPNSPVIANIFNDIFSETSDSKSLSRVEKIDLSSLTVEQIGLQEGVTKEQALSQINSYLKALFNSSDSIEPVIDVDYSVEFADCSFDESQLLKKDVAVTISSIDNSNLFIAGKSKRITVVSSTTPIPKIKRKQTLKLVTNPSFFSNYGTSVTPYNILKSTINLALDIANKIMIVFVLLSTVILSIILLVVIGIVVDEAKAAILTMKALGYNSLKVNWSVIGSYLIGLIISFAVAFVVSIIIWKIVLYWVTLEFGVYIFLGVDYRSAFITAPIVLFVLFVGWYAADKQVKKIPLTQITSMT